MPDWPAASIEARDEIPEGIAVLTYEELNTESIVRSVEDHRAGATAVFIGTTRNSFKGASCYVRGGGRHVICIHRQRCNTPRLSSV